MKLVCPRVIRGNRGDLLSRYSILAFLDQEKGHEIAVHCADPSHFDPLALVPVDYGWLYNLIPTWKGLQSLRNAEVVLWTGGLDLQDDSSLVKLLHTLCVFVSYRLLGLKIYVLMQGAGPLTTQWGKRLARLILDQVCVFIARDRGTLQLLQELHSTAQLVLAHDGIFLEGLNLSNANSADRQYVQQLASMPCQHPLIGFNIRLWFHFTSSFLPYHFAQKQYQARSHHQMEKLVESSIVFLKALRQQYHAKVLLISMYEPNIEPWEDDLRYLKRVKDNFETDDQVVLVDQPLTICGFCLLMSKLDLMIGARLHSTLAALRFGVPAIHLNYTLKGRDILTDMGLANWFLELEQFMDNPETALTLVQELLQSQPSKEKVQQSIQKAIQHNQQIMTDWLGTLSQGLV